MVTVSRRGDKLALQQRRFTYIDAPSAQVWHIPLSLTVWTADNQRNDMALLMDANEVTVALPANTAAYKINNHQSGFYRVCYEDEDNLAALGKCIQNQAMGVQDRWGIQNDLYALVRQGRVPLATYLAFLEHFGKETAFLPLTSMAGNLFQAMLISPEAQRTQIKALGKALVWRALNHCGYLPIDDEPHPTAALLPASTGW